MMLMDDVKQLYCTILLEIIQVPFVFHCISEHYLESCNRKWLVLPRISIIEASEHLNLTVRNAYECILLWADTK